MGRCELRPRECPYCEGVFRFEERIEHVEKCGARTRECEGCGEFVKAREGKRHMRTCGGDKPVKRTKPAL